MYSMLRFLHDSLRQIGVMILKTYMTWLNCSQIDSFVQCSTYIVFSHFLGKKKINVIVFRINMSSRHLFTSITDSWLFLFSELQLVTMRKENGFLTIIGLYIPGLVVSNGCQGCGPAGWHSEQILPMRSFGGSLKVVRWKNLKGLNSWGSML